MPFQLLDSFYLAPLTAILHQDLFEDQNIDPEIGFVIAEAYESEIVLPSERVMAVGVLPAVETMVTVDLGLW